MRIQNINPDSRRAVILSLVLVGLLATGAWLATARASTSSDSLLLEQRAKLTAPDGWDQDYFGSSTAIDGDTIVVGAAYADPAGNWNRGAAYVFDRNLGGPEAWGFKTKLISSDGAAEDYFGKSVAVDADTIAIGAIQAADNGIHTGAVYIFERNAGGPGAWGQVKKITVSDITEYDIFGASVALDGDTLAVGAVYVDVNGNVCQGVVYVFYRNQGGANNWGQVARLIASDGNAWDSFGQSVAVEGDILVATAYDTGDARGGAYIFYRNQGGADAWGELKKLVPQDDPAHDTLGLSIGLSGDTIASGGTRAYNKAVHIFQRNAGGADQWGQVNYTLAPSSSSNEYGNTLAIDGDTLLVGDYKSLEGGDYYTGVVHVYLRNLGGSAAWGKAALITASDPYYDDEFGYSIALDDKTASIGAYHADINNKVDQGADYVFSVERLPLTYSLKQVNPGAGRSGDAISWSVLLNNSGQAEVSDAALTDALPQFITYVDGSLTASKGQASYLDGVVSWNGPILAQETITVTFDAIINPSAPPSQPIINTAQIQEGGRTYSRSASVMVEPHLFFCPAVNSPCDPIYFDNFSNSGSGWPVADTGNVLYEYNSAEYRILVRPTEQGGGAYPGFQAADFVASVDLRNLNGGWGSYGLAFGLAPDWSSFYSLEIYPDGWFGLYRWSPSSITTLVEAYSDAIHQGSAANHLKIERNGSWINAYANGQRIVDDLWDSTLQGTSYLGLVAFTYNEPNLDVRYDNYTVWSLTCVPNGASSALTNGWQSPSGLQRFDFRTDKQAHP